MKPPYKPISGFAPINGAKIFFETAGEGHPLLLLHAGVADSRMWDIQVRWFSQHFKVIRCDLRGFGRSGVPPGSFSHHEDVASLLTHLGIEKTFVLGQSFGGQVALDLALSHPGIVDALVLGAPSLGGYQFSGEVLDFSVREDEAYERGDLDLATELNLRMWVDGPHRTPDQVDPTHRELVQEMQLHAFRMPWPPGAENRALDPPAVSRLGDIQVPTLVIIGSQDVPEFIRLSDIVTAGIPDARKAVMAGTTHLPSLEKPDEFDRIVLDFLGSL